LAARSGFASSKPERRLAISASVSRTAGSPSSTSASMEKVSDSFARASFRPPGLKVNASMMLPR
jgi:hypothetical protein